MEHAPSFAYLADEPVKTTTSSQVASCMAGCLTGVSRASFSSFPSLLLLSSFSLSAQDSFAWEQIRANWTRRPEGEVKSALQPSASRGTAQKLVQGGSIAAPVRLDDVISCLLVKWDEEAEEGV